MGCSLLTTWFYFIIKSLVIQLSSFIWDTSDFLRKLKSVGVIIDFDFLCMMDLARLYTNVPHEAGLEAFQYYFCSREQHLPSVELLLKMSPYR